MSDIHFITHPEVVIDPAVPVPDWPLAPEGIRRMGVALRGAWLSRIRAVFSGAERKAMDAAHLAATRFQLASIVDARNFQIKSGSRRIEA